ncbi:uncharacterized protein LOC133362995 [Lethenteron reissneri]|uniref:uncharacterized protein LOC133362995 n=1 Tax=Lethenteron reissneri TaxID=7753 RepID=UPI002AB61DB4|nr:uncharacterized protein LOC133362995 [Lethenteron reissneri]
MRTNRKSSRRTINEFCYQRRKICMKKSWPHPAEATPAEREPVTGGFLHVRLERVPVLERAASAGALSPESFRTFVTEEGWRCDEGLSREPASVTPRRSFRQAGGQAPERILDDPEELCRSWLPKAAASEKDFASPAAARPPPRADAAPRATPLDAGRRPRPAQEALSVGERGGAVPPTSAKVGARGQGGGGGNADGRGAKAAAAPIPAVAPPAQAVLAPPPVRAEAENPFTVKVRQAPDPALQESVAVPFRYSTYDPMLDVNPRLMRAFDAFPYPTRDRALRLARRVRVTAENLQAWFEAQRLKHGISWTPDEVLEARLRLRSSDTVDSDDDGVEAEEGGSGWPSGFSAGARTAAPPPPPATTTRGNNGRSNAGGHGQHEDGVQGGHARPWRHAEPTARHASGVANGDSSSDSSGDVLCTSTHDQVPERGEVLEPGEIVDLSEVVQRGDVPETQDTSLPTHIHMALWASFHESPFPSADKQERLCSETGLTLKTVQQWFEIWRSAGRLPTTSTQGASGAFTSNWKPNWSSENSAGLTGVRAEQAAPATIDIELGASDVGEDSDSDDDDGGRVAEEEGERRGTRERAGYASDASDASDPSYRPGNGRKAPAAAAAAAAPAQKQLTPPGHVPCERDILRVKFEENPWPTEDVVALLSNVLRMTPLQVRKSFSYRRQQQRKKLMLAERQQQQQEEEEAGGGGGRDKRPTRNARRRPPASTSPGTSRGHSPAQASEGRKRSPAPPGDVAAAIARALPLISLNEAFLMERSPSDATLRRLVEQTGLAPQDVADFFERKRRRSNGAAGGPVAAGGPLAPAAAVQDVAPESVRRPGHALIKFSDEGAAVDAGAGGGAGTNGAREGRGIMVVIGSVGCGIGGIVKRMGGDDGGGEH